MVNVSYNKTIKGINFRLSFSFVHNLSQVLTTQSPDTNALDLGGNKSRDSRMPRHVEYDIDAFERRMPKTRIAKNISTISYKPKPSRNNST